MATYSYVCECGARTEQTFHIGTARRILRCPDCAGTMRLRIGAGVNIAPSALETKGGEVRATNAREDRWHKDIPAYVRMRRKGMQPKNIDGSARLEDTVGEQFDIDYGRFYAQGLTKPQVEDGVLRAEAIMEEVNGG